MQQSAARRESDNGQRVRHGLGGECGTFERIKRDIDYRSLAGPDRFTDVEHGRFVALTFADDDAAIHFDGVKRGPHGIDGGLIGGLFIATANLGITGDGGFLSDANDVEAKVEVRGIAPPGIFCKIRGFWHYFIL